MKDTRFRPLGPADFADALALYVDLVGDSPVAVHGQTRRQRASCSFSTKTVQIRISSCHDVVIIPP